MALNDTAIRALKAKKNRYEVTDRDGLLLEIHPSGKKVWRYRYRLNGKREKLTIGPFPAIGLADARERRLNAEKAVNRQESPALTKKREKEAERRSGGRIHTVNDLAESWIESVLKLANKNHRQDETYVRRDLLPSIGKEKPDEVSANDIWRCAEAVLKRGHPQAARRVRNAAKRMFDFALSQGLVRANPAATIKPTHLAPSCSRTRTLNADEIRQWLNAVYTSRLTRNHKLALHFLLLVPARKGELILSKWSHFDLESSTWDIPAELSKNGAPIRHKLPKQALALVREMQLIAGKSEWVLPSSRNLGRMPISKTTLNCALKSVDGMPQNAVIHDLRRTIRTGLSELGGIPSEVAELCLNHRPSGVEGVYDRSERLSERARALQRWADQLDALRTGAKVIPIKRGA
jgi:integrase